MGGDLTTMTNGDPHNHKRQLKNSLSKVRQNPDISKHNKELLEQFYSYLVSQDLSDSRINRHLQCIRVLAEHIDYTLEICSKTQMRELVADINTNEIKERKLSDSTKAEYRKTLIKFYSDFLENMKEDIPSLDESFDGENLTNFFTSTTRRNIPDPDLLPTPNTVRQLVKNTDKTRDKALLMILWSTGGRISEILGLQWQDVRFQQNKGHKVAKVIFRDTKTGDNRKVPVRSGYVYLKNLQNKDSRSSEAEAYVFRSEQTDTQLSYRSAYKVIKRARKRSDVDAHIKTNPHAFRKGRATFLAAQGMNQASLCDYMGWVQGSKEAAVYVKLAESDKENSIMKVSGLEVRETEREKDVLPVKCPECGELNIWEAVSCVECGQVITQGEMFEMVQVEEKTGEFMEEIIRSQTEYNPETINEKAKEFVKKEFDI